MDVSSEGGGKVNQQPPTASAVCQLPDHRELAVLTSKRDLVAKG